MVSVRHKLMRREGTRRIAAAKALRGTAESSDSAYLLELLGFELLLKVTFEVICSKQAPKHHRYDKIFAALPVDVQTRLLQLAADRSPPVDLTEPSKVLKDLGNNFIDLRYPYEKYGEMTESQYAAAGSAWLAGGGDDATADYRYHPEELFALTMALSELTHGC